MAQVTQPDLDKCHQKKLMQNPAQDPQSSGEVSRIAQAQSTISQIDCEVVESEYGESDDEDISESATKNDTPDILYEVRYKNMDGDHVYSRPLPRPAAEIEYSAGAQPAVMKLVQVRSTWLDSGALEFHNMPPNPKTKRGDRKSKKRKNKRVEKYQVNENIDESGEDEPITLPPFDKEDETYIEIISPVIRDALRSIVDYYPGQALDTRSIRISWPFALLAHYDEALEKYQGMFEKHKCNKLECPGEYTHKHIGTLRNFMRQSFGDAIDEERRRHKHGLATFEMLWLLYKPGDDILIDRWQVGEYEPYVVKDVSVDAIDGSIQSYYVICWNMNADIDTIGPCDEYIEIAPFAGEKEITSLIAYPFRYLKRDKSGKDAESVKKYFIERGMKFFNMQKKGCWYFQGHGTGFPRLPYEGLVMVDPIQSGQEAGSVELAVSFEVDHSKQASPGFCMQSKKMIDSQRRPFKFAGYSRIIALEVSQLTEHQYFLCHNAIKAYVLKIREWVRLQVSGMKQPDWDLKMLDTLVLEPHTKRLIQGLTEKYIQGLKADDEQELSLVKPVRLNSETRVLKESSWSADFIKGKGEGLIFLLHGKPGVGKTYTAECIAASVGRPLLTLTCADIGTNPSAIDKNLRRWFKLATSWNAIMLIDEADIYMEHRKVQDLERNNLVAVFLRAMEYYKGILFLTTNRVGTFDEAFISRINLCIYYKPFSPEARKAVWEGFFRKLEKEKEDTMRIHANTRDYVEDSEELNQLGWNGRDIRNAFQIAVALAEAENDRDSRGRILIKKEHIQSTVEMSKTFKHYMKQLHKKDEDSIAAARGNRYDAPEFGKTDKMVFN